MQCVEHRVEVQSGQVAVIEYVPDGGHDEGAVPVLLVHSAGLCAANWNVLAEHLGPSVAAWAIDMPGHGYSTADYRHASDGWRHLPSVMRELGIQRPLLVYHEYAAFPATVAALRDPDAYRGLIGVGSPVLDDTEATLEAISFVHSQGFVDTMGERFRFGATGIGVQAADHLKDFLVRHSKQDWLTVEFGDGLETEVERSTEFRADGTWLHKPTIATMKGWFTLAEGDPDMPDEHFYEPLGVPLWILTLTESFQDLTPAQVERAAEHPLMRVLSLQAGPWPQYGCPGDLAALIETIAADPHQQEADAVAALGGLGGRVSASSPPSPPSTAGR